MSNKSGVVIAVVVILLWGGALLPAVEPVQAAPPVAQVGPLHRAGQTFLTWPEVPDDAGAVITYRIYRQSTPPAEGLLESARVADVPQGSAIYWTEIARTDALGYDTALYPGLRTYIIENLGAPLPDGTGLFVWTAHETGEFYYAIVPVIDGVAQPEMATVSGPVAETVLPPQPVLVWQSADGNARVYTQFMDYAAYNPTYDAPSPFNDWMSLPEDVWASPLAPHFQQYAYNYFVGLPTEEQCEGPVPDVLPLVLEIEGWGSRYEVPASSPWFCAVHVWGDDPNQSWYFGFSATHDYRSGEGALTGPIVNYTEQRLLWAVDSTLNDPALPAIDPQRVYVYGHSMGGTGALALAQRYPNVFAAAHASQPMVDFAASALWVHEAEAKWGPRADNLPVEIGGPFADHLAAYNGTSVWTWQSLGAQLTARRGDEMAFIWMTHGTQDTVIDWQTVVRPAYVNLYAGNHAFAARIDAMDHTWVGFMESPLGGFTSFALRRDDSFPAFTHASGSLSLPPDGPGGYNATLTWSGTWGDEYEPPVDEPALWSVVIRSLDGPQTVDVTPRRLGQFVVQPGMAFDWHTERDGGPPLAGGTVTADADGLITIPGVVVDEAGVRLVIGPAG